MNISTLHPDLGLLLLPVGMLISVQGGYLYTRTRLQGNQPVFGIHPWLHRAVTSMVAAVAVAFLLFFREQLYIPLITVWPRPAAVGFLELAGLFMGFSLAYLRWRIASRRKAFSDPVPATPLTKGGRP